MSECSPILITDPADNRLAAFMQLKDKSLKQEGLLIAEGQILVQRVLQSDLELEALLVVPRLLEMFDRLVGGQCPIYVVDESLLHEVVGYEFHRGVMLCAKTPAMAGIAELTMKLDAKGSQRSTLVVLPEVNDVENLGAIIRSAAALGIDGIVLGERCSDPFYRRVIRVSMGAVFDLPIAVAADLKTELGQLKEAGYRLAGTVLDEKSIELNAYERPEKLAMLFGAEGPGLWDGYASQCDDLLTITMANEVDSLNLAMAATVFMYQLR